MKLTLPYPPTANTYWRHVGRKVLLSAEARAYRTEVAWKAKLAGVRPLSGPVVVALDVYRPRRIGDLDNRIKQLLDALRDIAFEDDDQVVDIHARRFDDKANPRVEVTVEVSE